MLSGKAKGVISIIISAFGFSLMALFVRLCDDYGGPISAFQKGFFRNLVAFAIALIVFLRTPHASSVLCGLGRGRAILPLLLRSILGTAGIFAHFLSIT